MNPTSFQTAPPATPQGFNPVAALKSIGTATIIVIVLLLVFFFVGLSEALTFYPEKAIKGFQIWRALLFPFASHGWIDLLLNIAATFALGSLLEKEIGSINFFLRILADALLLSLLIETPFYFLFSFFWTWMAGKIWAWGMVPILIVETASQALTDPSRSMSLFGQVNFPQVALPVGFALIRLLWGDMSGLWAIIAGVVHNLAFKSCAPARLTPQTLFNYEKSLIPLDRVGNFYTLNNKQGLSAGHPIYSGSTPTPSAVTPAVYPPSAIGATTPAQNPSSLNPYSTGLNNFPAFQRDESPLTGGGMPNLVTVTDTFATTRDGYKPLQDVL